MVQDIRSIDGGWRLWEISDGEFRVGTRNVGVRGERNVALRIVVNSFPVQ